MRCTRWFSLTSVSVLVFGCAVLLPAEENQAPKHPKPGHERGEHRQGPSEHREPLTPEQRAERRKEFLEKHPKLRDAFHAWLEQNPDAKGPGKLREFLAAHPEKREELHALFKANRPERPEGGERPERPGRPEKGERPERGERPEKGERPGKGERPERPGRPEKGERPERPAMPPVEDLLGE